MNGGLLQLAKNQGEYKVMTAEELKNSLRKLYYEDKTVVEPKLRLSGKRKGFLMSTKKKR